MDRSAIRYTNKTSTSTNQIKKEIRKNGLIIVKDNNFISMFFEEKHYLSKQIVRSMVRILYRAVMHKLFASLSRQRVESHLFVLSETSWLPDFSYMTWVTQTGLIVKHAREKKAVTKYNRYINTYVKRITQPYKTIISAWCKNRCIYLLTNYIFVYF